jgi:hypothetical protein
LSSVGVETGQIVLRYPAPADEKSAKRLPDLGPEVRGGKSAYWCAFAKDSKWMDKLLNVLSQLRQQSY